MIQMTYDLDDYSHNIPFSENLIYVHWSYSISIDHIISEICNSIIRMEILMGDSTTLLDYKLVCRESACNGY